jgi:hypothetical protein
MQIPVTANSHHVMKQPMKSSQKHYLMAQVATTMTHSQKMISALQESVPGYSLREYYSR